MKLDVDEKPGVAGEYLIAPAIEGVHRVVVRGETVGYVLVAGPVFVALRGGVFNTSIEVGQALDLDHAAQVLAA